jgi:hypothetical protein
MIYPVANVMPFSRPLATRPVSAGGFNALQPLGAIRFGQAAPAEPPAKATKPDNAERKAALIAQAKHYAMTPDGLALDALRAVGYGAISALGTPAFIVTYPICVAGLAALSMIERGLAGWRGKSPKHTEANLKDYWKKANWGGVKTAVKDYLKSPKQWLKHIAIGTGIGIILGIGPLLAVLTIPAGIFFMLSMGLCDRIQQGLATPTDHANAEPPTTEHAANPQG